MNTKTTHFFYFRMRTLRGHSHWVKNIEYSSQNNLLVTSGFDGAIYTWELNKFTEGRSEGCHNKVRFCLDTLINLMP